MRALALVALLAFAAAAAQVAVPPLSARVTDLTGTFTAEQRAGLEQRLAAFEQEKGSQVAVLIVPSTQPEEIEPYATRVFDAWKLGRKGVDDGVLLLVAKDDRRMKIEVGYGLEGALPDAIAKRIISETITPYFRNGDFHGGIAAGVEQLLKVIQGEPLPEPPKERRRPHGLSFDTLLTVGIFMVAVAHMLGGAFGEFKGSLAAGGIYGAIAWFIIGVAAWAAIAAGVLFLFALLTQAFRTPGGGGGFGGGFGGGSVGSGSFGGGGGGFSGGGGSSGGGGASGSW